MRAAYDLRVLSLGAGVQSTTVYLMALNGALPLPALPDVAIFADTRWEPKEIYAHLSALERLGGDRIPIYRVSTGDLRQDVLDAVGSYGKIEHIGQPPFFVRNPGGDGLDRGGMLRRKCTTTYKIEPIYRKIRELLGFQPGERIAGKALVQQWFGISLDEAHRMRDSRVEWIENYYPLVERRTTRKDCIHWLRAHRLAVPRKSACLGCPYHSSGTWREMRDHHPEEWADVVEFDAALRRGKLPGVIGDAYLHRSMLPLPQAVDRAYDPAQFDLFGSECEGMCGV